MIRIRIKNTTNCRIFFKIMSEHISAYFPPTILHFAFWVYLSSYLPTYTSHLTCLLLPLILSSYFYLSSYLHILTSSLTSLLLPIILPPYFYLSSYLHILTSSLTSLLLPLICLLLPILICLLFSLTKFN